MEILYRHGKGGFDIQAQALLEHEETTKHTFADAQAREENE